MKKFLIGLGCVAIVVAGLYGYDSYKKSDTGIRDTIRSYCSDKEKEDVCVCFYQALWVGFGREKFYKVVEIMREKREEERVYYTHKLLVNGTEDEIEQVSEWMKKCSVDGE